MIPTGAAAHCPSDSRMPVRGECPRWDRKRGGKSRSNAVACALCRVQRLNACAKHLSGAARAATAKSRAQRLRLTAFAHTKTTPWRNALQRRPEAAGFADRRKDERGVLKNAVCLA